MLSISKRVNNRGFTLMELLIAIAILGILATVGLGGYFTSLKKGRDARRKAALEQVQRALEMYYNDHGRYPEEGELDFDSTGQLTDGTTIYMQKLPSDPKNGFKFDYETDDDGTFFQLYACLENKEDEGSGVNQDGYAGSDCGCSTTDGFLCNYGISSPNTEP